MYGTIGWIADAAGRSLCGGYRSLAGTLPEMCRVNGGHALLGIACVVLLGLALSVLAWRSLKA